VENGCKIKWQAGKERRVVCINPDAAAVQGDGGGEGGEPLPPEMPCGTLCAGQRGSVRVYGRAAKWRMARAARKAGAQARRVVGGRNPLGLLHAV